uniref:Uncharacterized protein n=2 Tax=Meloidogyne TaxID=189290 RepID=A0A914KT79_MELIC
MEINYSNGRNSFLDIKRDRTNGKSNYLICNQLLHDIPDSIDLDLLIPIYGNGEDSGVLYREMQIRETMKNIVDQKRREMFYGDNLGYSVLTGSLLKEIRENCSLERIKQYHEKYYNLDNVLINFELASIY